MRQVKIEKKGKGVMSKDGITPYASQSIMAHLNGSEYVAPYRYDIETLLGLLADTTIDRIEVITKNNDLYHLTVAS